MEWSLNSIAKTPMHKGRLFIVMVSQLLIFFVSCKSANPKSELQFYYYPEKNVYYDTKEKTFFYSLNGAKSWSAFKAGNAADVNSIGEKIVVSSNSREVYGDNENHRKLYAGTLLKIVAEDTGSVTVGPEAIERKVVKKKGGVTGRKPGAKRTGIGRFISKIFGKNK